MIKQKLRERGYIFDPFGRRYHLELSRAYVGLNRLIQGWAASMFKVGFVRTCALFASPWYGGQVHPIMRRPMMMGPKVLTCVHDELDSEVPVEFDDGLLDFSVRSCMTLMGGLRIPLSTSSESSAKSWDDAGSRDYEYGGL
jgi:DNA polymerase I-like protein with 3'-5' exonuclease and polymerase domains